MFRSNSISNLRGLNNIYLYDSYLFLLLFFFILLFYVGYSLFHISLLLLLFYMYAKFFQKGEVKNPLKQEYYCTCY